MSVVQAGQALRASRIDDIASQRPSTVVQPPTPPPHRPPVATGAPRQSTSTATPRRDEAEPVGPDLSIETIPAQPTDGTVDATPAPAVADLPLAGRPLDGGILFSDASRRWTEILETCGTKNRSVQALLRSAHPLTADSEGLVLGFPYAFHRERIADLKNRVVVEEVIEQVLGQRVSIRCVVSTGRDSILKTDTAQAALDDPLVQAAIAMGARVTAVSENRPEE